MGKTWKANRRLLLILVCEMTAEEARNFIRNGVVSYHRIVFFHKDLMGFSRPCSIFELMYLLGSEKGSAENPNPRFEKVKLDDHYISHIPLKRFVTIKDGGATITKEMAEDYPWFDLAKSLEEEGFRIPVLAAIIPGEDGLFVIEGKHRATAASLIKPYNPDFLIPCILTVIDTFYTCKMFKQRHPDPSEDCGYRLIYDR